MTAWLGLELGTKAGNFLPDFVAAVRIASWASSSSSSSYVMNEIIFEMLLIYHFHNGAKRVQEEVGGKVGKMGPLMDGSDC